MERIEGSEFNVYLKPLDWANVEDGALKVNNLTKEFIEEKGVGLKEGFQQFVSYLGRYNKTNSVWGAPISSGYNIDNFDMPIIRRLCTKFGNVDKDGGQTIFNKLFSIDLKNIMFMWFENNKEPENYKFDTFREYLGLSKVGAHNAITDTCQTADVLIRFMKYHRKHAAKTSFKGAFGVK